MAPAPVKVWPTKASALNVKHPHGPQMTLAGVYWPNDSFTARRLADGSATAEKGRAYVPPKVDAPQSAEADAHHGGLVTEPEPEPEPAKAD